MAFSEILLYCVSQRGENKFSSNTNNYLSVDGVNIFANASGDGLDANGSIYIKGGNIEVAGPMSSGNGALDYDRECIITGGEFIAYGSSGMSQKPSSSSTQYVVTINGNYSEGDKLEIINGENVVYTCTLKKKCQSIIISSNLLKADTEYSLRINNEIVETFRVSNIVTSIGGGTNGVNGAKNEMEKQRPNNGNRINPNTEKNLKTKPENLGGREFIHSNFN